MGSSTHQTLNVSWDVPQFGSEVLSDPIFDHLMLLVIQCPPLNVITAGRHKSDNNNRMIQLTDVFCELFIYDWVSNI
jgi:hypothetical protein